MLNKKFVYFLNYFKINETFHKNNLRTHSPHQNKKAVLKAAAYFKVSHSRKVRETIVEKSHAVLLPEL